MQEEEGEKTRAEEHFETVGEQMDKQGWFAKGEANLEGLNSDTQQVIYEKHKKVFEKFPQIKGQFEAPKVGSVRNGQAQYFGGTGKGQVTLDKDTFTNIERYANNFLENVENGHFPKGLEWGSAVTHELGHAIDDYLTMEKHAGGFNMKTLVPNDASQVLRTEVLKELKLGQIDIGGELSNYATKSHREFFAEAFAEYMDSTSPRPVAQLLGEKLEKLMEKVVSNG